MRMINYEFSLTSVAIFRKINDRIQEEDWLKFLIVDVNDSLIQKELNSWFKYSKNRLINIPLMSNF